MKKEQKFAILIPLLFIAGGLIHKSVEHFRIIPDLHWIFEYGSLFGIALSISSTVWSLIYCVIFFRDKTPIKNNFIWLFLAALPILYVSVVIIISQ